MTALLDALKGIILTVVERLGYGGLAILSLLENLVPPLPSEFVLPFAGFLVAEGRLSLTLVLLATSLGGFLGTSAFYWLGRRLGDAKVRAFIRRFGRYALLTEADYDEALGFFQKHDAAVAFWGRFVPGLRSLISLPAGVAGMPFGRFATYTLLGTVLWNAALLLAGWWLGDRWQLVLATVDRFDGWVWAALGLGLVAWIGWRRSAQTRAARRNG